MRLGIVAAFDREVRSLVDWQDNNPGRGGAPFHIAVATAGVGGRRARYAGQRLLHEGAQALLSWGVAAALKPELAPGSLVMPTTIIGVDSTAFSVDHDWHRDLAARLAQRYVIHTQPLAETTVVLSDAADKRALRARSNAIAADMESAALAALAREAGVPFLAIRAVSDRADARVPHWLMACIDDAGDVSVGKALGRILTSPSQWAAILGLALGFRAARATLRGVSEHIGPRLSTVIGAPKTQAGANIAGQSGADCARE